MRKNIMMRLASILLVLVLATTSVIGGTFAKYTTSDNASDDARVAKWGVSLQVFGNLYGDTYDAVANGNSITNKESGFTVQSGNTTDDLVAPGTRNDSGFKFSLQGVPEVAGKITFTAQFANIYLNVGTYGVMVPVTAGIVTAQNFDEFGDLYVKNSGVYSKATINDVTSQLYTLEDEVKVDNIYYPVQYQMIGKGTDVTSYNADYSKPLTEDTMMGIVDLILEKFPTVGTLAPAKLNGQYIRSYSQTFEANANLQTLVDIGDQQINWKWDFCEGKACYNEHACAHCKYDTILGNLMAGTELNGEVVKLDGTTYKVPVADESNSDLADYNLNTTFNISITVEQVD